MVERGGYQRPSNPAPTSGPGRLSRRTDGGPTKPLTGGGEYGETKELTELQQSADMRPEGSQRQGGIDRSAVIPLDAPSAYADQPITAGINPDVDPNAELDKADVAALLPYLPALEHMANRSNLPSTRAMIRRIKGMI